MWTIQLPARVRSAGCWPGLGPLAAHGLTRALVLAVDAPTVTVEDLAPLLAAVEPGAFYDGLPLPMMLSLSALPADAEAAWPLRRLVERAGLATLACDEAVRARLRGANTPEERTSLNLSSRT